MPARLVGFNLSSIVIDVDTNSIVGVEERYSFVVHGIARAVHHLSIVID